MIGWNQDFFGFDFSATCNFARDKMVRLGKTVHDAKTMAANDRHDKYT